MSPAELLSTELFQVSGVPITVGSVVVFALILVATFWASWLARRITGRALARSGVTDPGTTSTVLRLLHYGVLVVGMGIGLQTIGISLASLFAAGAVVAVAIGFALQNVLQNFVSGVILLAERSIKERDVLEVQGEQVIVQKLGARATVARNRDDDEIIIPNTVLVQGTVTNQTLGDTVHRIRARVGVSYESDMKAVEAALLRAAASIEARTMERDPFAMLLEFGDSSVVWEVSIWCEDPWAARATRSDLNKAIWWAFKEDGITISYPQLDVHLIDTPESNEGSARA